MVNSFYNQGFPDIKPCGPSLVKGLVYSLSTSCLLEVRRISYNSNKIATSSPGLILSCHLKNPILNIKDSINPGNEVDKIAILIPWCNFHCVFLNLGLVLQQH